MRLCRTTPSPSKSSPGRSGVGATVPSFGAASALTVQSGLRVVAERATRRRGEKAGPELTRAAPPARQLSRLLTMQRDHLSKGDAIMVAAVEIGVPALAVARGLLERFPVHAAGPRH